MPPPASHPGTTHSPSQLFHTDASHEQQRQRSYNAQFGTAQDAMHHPGSVSGATNSSGPRSTASDESLHPGQYAQQYAAQQQNLPTHQSRSSPEQPARLAQSQSLPHLDDFDGPFAVQQRAPGAVDNVSFGIIARWAAGTDTTM